MQGIMEKHGVSIFLSVATIVLIGYIDVRVAISRLETTMDGVSKAVAYNGQIARTTRDEQLQRTDEIEFIQGLRERGYGHVEG